MGAQASPPGSHGWRLGSYRKRVSEGNGGLGSYFLGVDVPRTGADSAAISLLRTQGPSLFLTLEPLSYFPTSSAIHSNGFRGSAAGGFLWTHGPHCTRSLHYAFLPCLRGWESWPCQHCSGSRAEAREPGRSRPPLSLQGRSGLCAFSLSASWASAVRGPNSTLCQPQGHESAPSLHSSCSSVVPVASH